MATKKLSKAQARRIALRAQGFGEIKPAGRVDVRHFRRAMDRMKILQIDSVNVCARSHFMPMFARLGPYDRDALDKWLWTSGENHEYLAHEASLTPVDVFPLLRHRKNRGRWARQEDLERDAPGYLEAVRSEVLECGPISIRELSDPGDRTGPWWGHSRGKFALDILAILGEISICDRTHSFVTYYDDPAKVLPPEALAEPMVGEEEATLQLLLLGAKAHGVASLAEIADYFRIRMPKARPALAKLVEQQLLEPVSVDGYDETMYLHPEAIRPRSMDVSTFLSPFDPITWFRPRGEQLFDFFYKIEIYVPEAKRKYGYYSLPFLLGDELVGRVDMKADRKAGTLLAQGSFVEDGQDPLRVGREMATQMVVMADWLGLESIEIKDNGNAAASIEKALG